MSDDERLNFPWRRRFRRVASSEKVPFDADGYLSPYADWLDDAHGLETIEHLEAQSCVVILGESGLGKSQVLEELASRAATRGDHVSTIELSTVSGWADLASRFSAALRASSSERRPTVLMDDFEHCPVGADFEKHLAAALEGVDRKPGLRMAIRAGAWTPALEQRLRRLFGGEAVGVYELCPLTRRQAAEAFEGLPSAAHEVVARLEAGGAAPLLALPVTLLMLRADVAASGVPAAVDRGEVYRRAMRRMVDWKQEARRHQLDPDARLAIARRLAAVSVFCNKRTYRTDLGAPDLPTVGGLAELATDHGEPVHGDRQLASVRVEDLLEVLRESGLFVRVGPHEVSWRHASFADFLAAGYLQLHGVKGARLRSLLAMTPGGEGPPIALEGVAGWLAVHDDAVWTELARRRPCAVLRANVAALSEQKRAVLCDALFEAVAEARIGWFSAEGLTRRLGALAHPTLGNQIRARLAGPLSERALAEVLAVAVACRDAALAPDLAQVALDVSRPLDVRTRAATAVRLTDHAQAKLALRPLLLDDERDAADDLLGHALFTLWPAHLSARDMFASLRHPRRGNRHGEYQSFLMRLASDLDRASLPEALEWARVRPAGGPLAWDTDLVDAIARAALEQADPASLLPAVLDIFERRYVEHQPLLRAAGPSGAIEAFPTGLRREMLRHVGSRTESRLLRNAAFTEPELLNVIEDVGWLIDELSLDVDRGGFVVLLEAALRSHRRLDDSLTERLGRLAERSSAVHVLVARVQAEHDGAAARARAEVAQRAGRPTLADRRAAHEQEVRQHATAFIAGDDSSATFLALHLGTPARGSNAWTVLPVEQHEPLATAVVRWLASWPEGPAARSREAVVWALSIALQRGATAELPQSFWPRFVGTVERPFPYLLRGVDLGCVRDAIVEHARAELRAVITGVSGRTAQRGPNGRFPL